MQIKTRKMQRKINILRSLQVHTGSKRKQTVSKRKQTVSKRKQTASKRKQTVSKRKQTVSRRQAFVAPKNHHFTAQGQKHRTK